MLLTFVHRKVYLAQRKGDPKIYAMKVMKKEMLRRKNMVDQGLTVHFMSWFLIPTVVVTERNAMALALNPFIARLYYSFRSQGAMYLVP